MLEKYIIAIITLLSVCACSVTPSPSDVNPPNHVISSLESSIKIVFRTDGGSPDEDGLCPAGQNFDGAFSYLNSTPSSGLNSYVYVIPGNGNIKLLVSFSDPSGIKSVRISMPTGTVISPTTGVSVQTASHGSSEFDVNVYEFTGDPSDPKSPHLVSIELAPDNDSYRWFSVKATDFNDNEAPSEIYLIGNANDLCQ